MLRVQGNRLETVWGRGKPRFTSAGQHAHSCHMLNFLLLSEVLKSRTLSAPQLHGRVNQALCWGESFTGEQLDTIRLLAM